MAPEQSSSKTRLQELLIFLSAFLLALAFPKFNLGWTAWFALVPGLFSIFRSHTKLQSFTIFFLIGFFFDLISLEWLRHVTYLGWIFVCVIPAIYFGLFGFCAHYFLREHRIRFSFLALPSLWVVLEWFRTEISVWAFGWNLLGYSQSEFLSVARLASWLGVYGVSFLIVFVNVTLWFCVEFWKDPKKRLKVLRKLLYATLLVWIVVSHFSRPMDPEGANANNLSSVYVAVVQGNIPQSEKWNPEVKSNIIQTYQKLSELIVPNKPDLLIWPEAAWPGILNLDPEREEILKFVRSAHIPFLIGSPYEETLPEFEKPARIFNSAYFINSQGEVVNRYDKIHLVPFGEFVPFTSFFNLFGLEKYAYSLGVGDFSPGREYTVFELPKLETSIRFSTLICFEDTFLELSRRFVNHGAQFLTVITNDAWFGKSAAPYQHLQASIFRALENGVPVIRAANTGVSAFVLPTGEVIDRIQDQQGHDTWIAGGLARVVLLKDQQTIYRHSGFLFPLFCALFGLASFFLAYALSPRK
ncbi:MAG: apolipoprotein N-acyltransferase [Candidatus Omnitrophica bacterium]|nr:apolipoprotein N-acyltransferase [Candidatus Omnitrophota bacterium]